MEQDENIDLSKRKFTSRLIVQQALARGWKVTGFKTNPAIFLLHVPGRAPLPIFSASPPDMSYPAAKIAKDKYITNQLLKAADLPVPEDCLVGSSTSASELNSFLERHKALVVKPLDASHGKGITTGIDSMNKLQEALQEARVHTQKETILAQEQIEGVDVRVLCIGYTFVGAISRIPASVVGDGKHTVQELIQLTNSSGERGENYVARLNVIPLDQAQRFLGITRLHQVPAPAEEVQVIGVSNIGMGGVRQNLTKEVPVFLQELAVRAAKTIGLPVCGVDFIVKRLPRLNDEVDDLDPKVIEVNECPMLTMYDDVDSKEQLQVINTYLDYLIDKKV